jgi:hypothetical protein
MQFQSREAQQRQSLQKDHMKNLPPGAAVSGGSANMPPSSDPSFNTSGTQGQAGQFTGASNNRIGQNKMLPPPSPASGSSKDHLGSKDSKVGISNPPNGHPDGSPRVPPNIGQAQGGPNTPQGGNASSTTPATSGTLNMTEPSPSSMMGNPSTSMNPAPQSMSTTDPMQPNLFPTDFMLDDFQVDPSIFRPDTDLNFERDFGQWFTDDVSLDLK